MGETLRAHSRDGEPLDSGHDDPPFDAGGYSSFHDVDTLAEVDAAFRSQRRIAVGYFALFLIGILGLALGTVRSTWATTGRVLGGFSPSFMMTAIGLYGFFVVIAMAAAGLANAVDRRMLGASSLEAHDRPVNRRRRSARRAARRRVGVGGRNR